MNDYLIIWTNEQYRRMTNIGIGHSPDDFTNKDYITLITDAVNWAASK
ncbi:ThuA domain-containing protein [Mucilaginibacter gilvus]|nr:ThuA domain-containing protein [Mucilaginibacter gilvus]